MLVPYPTSIWHRMTKFGRNQSEIFYEIDVFVGSLHANFDQNRLNVKKYAKNSFQAKHTKDQYRCKMTRSTKWLSRNFKILRFWPSKLKKQYILENLYKIQFFFRNLKNRNRCHRTSCLLPSCQILRKPINIWYPNRSKIFKNYAYQNLQFHFLKF